MSLKELRELHGLWQENAQARAYGGLRAISGFTFQVECAIERALRLFLKSPSAGPSIVVEAISDIAEVKRDLICAVQVKRTLTSATWNSAVEEFAEIRKITEKKRPDLAGRLRFEVLCREDHRSSKGASEKKESENAVRVTIAPNPRTLSLVLLWQEFHAEDPLLAFRELSARIHETLGRLAPTESGEEIWSVLTKLWKARSTTLPPPGLILQASIYERDQSSSDTEVLLSRQPTFTDLRLGRVMERSEILESLMGKLHAWLGETTTSFVDVSRSFEYALRVFWIAGRSGDGKSVALLQAIACLHKQGYGPILFLGNDLPDLPRALELLTEWKHEEPAIVAIDDPYGKDIERGGTLWTQIWNFVNTHDPLGVSPRVVVIACGPSEQCDRFETELGEAVRVQRLTLSPVSTPEIQKISSWYTERTGRACEHLTEKNPLMVQLVFEMRHGSIERFAIRFRRRLAEIGLASPQGEMVESPRPLDIALAVNRLYVAAPKDLLTDRQLDNLLPLLKEEHFEFNQDLKSEGLRLAHPHLANLIYNVWFPEDQSKNTRISHIVSAFSHQLKKRDPRERFSILWALRPEVGRVTEDFVQDCIARLYEVYLANCNYAPDPSGLPGWIALSNWWQGIDLNPNPVTLAMKHLREGSYEATGTRLLCHQLLERARVRADPQCIEAVVGILERAWDWREWPWVASDLMRIDSHGRLLKDLEVLQMVLNWINDHPTELEVPLALLNFKGTKWSKISDLIKYSLRTAQQHPMWPRLCWGAQRKARFVQNEASEDQEIHDIAIDWCERQPLSPPMVFLVGNAVRAVPGNARAKELARRLIRYDKLYLHNNFLLEPLLATDLSEWAEPAAEWAIANPGHPSPSFVLERLNKHYDVNSPIGTLILEWLVKNPDDPGWSYVWEAWVKQHPGKPLFEAGKKWLAIRPEHKGWVFVWTTFVELAPVDDEVIALAYNWLNSHPNHGSWLDVWEKLRDLYPSDERVTALAGRAEFWKTLEKASIESAVVEGIITERIEGGFWVNIGESGMRGFLPGSHVDIRPASKLEKFVGMRSRFAVVKYDRKRGNVVVSRRDLLEKEKESSKRELLKVLEEGVVLEGTVKNVTGYGAFVDLGGIDGILHISDMSWGRTTHPSEVVKVGDRIKVQVLKFDPARERVSLGMKQIMPNPWDFVEAKYPVGSRVQGRVISLVDFGAFVDLERGVEGLIHVSELSWDRTPPHPSKVVQIGETIEVLILNVDPTRRRIGLGLEQLRLNPWQVAKEKYPVGNVISGPVRNITDFALFIAVEDGLDGMVHVSDLHWTKKIKHPSEVYKKGDIVQAKVLEVDGEKKRFLLGIKQLEIDPWTQIPRRYPVGSRINGEVTNVVDFGIFVRLDEGVEGLIHVSDLDAQEGDHPSKFFKVGDSVKAQVIRIDAEEKKIALSIRVLKNT